MKICVYCGVGALAALIVMFLLLVREPTISYDQSYDSGGVVRAECGSVAQAAWSGYDGLLFDAQAQPVNPPLKDTYNYYGDCDQRRLGYVALMCPLAVLASVLGTVALLARPGRDRALVGGTPPAASSPLVPDDGSVIVEQGS